MFKKPKVSCKYHSICSVIYADEIKDACNHFTNKPTHCTLASELESGQVSDFVKTLLKKEAKKSQVSTSNLNKVVCPRSVMSQISISKPCFLCDCSFYSAKLSYNCFLIHQQVFFSDHNTIPQKLLEIGSKLDKNSYKRMLDISIYMARSYLITLKYMLEFYNIDIDLKFKTKIMKKAFPIQQSIDLCDLCGTPLRKKACSCFKNKQLRTDRIIFSNKWNNVITRSAKNLDNISLDTLNPKDLTDNLGNRLYSLRLIRALLNTISLKGVMFKDIPFGYVYATYNSLFSDKEWKRGENLGLTEELYEKANSLFSKDTF